MTNEPSGRAPRRTPAPRGRRYKPQVLELADGGKLVLGVHGSIDQVDDHGSQTHSWTPDDPEWADHAIRFGLHTQAPTVAPHGPVQGRRPPRR